jgi:UDP-N-acetylmuramyl pentapeptide phosphotransferase/UDP-N-acetylglucosamine-1-phosphate transferase
VRGRLLTGAVSAAAGAAAGTALHAKPPGGAGRWGRTNHRGEAVTLLEGPAYAAGAVTGALLAPGISGRIRLAGLVATTGAAVLGGYDDLAGDGSSRGLGGHLKALLRGEVSTGAVKVAGLGLCGLVSAALLHPGAGDPADARGGVGRAVDVATSGALIAGSANLINLLDLRPGRALKVVAALGVVTSLAGGDGAPLAASATGPALGALPADLGERSMLGDTGANAAGALLGTAWAAGLSRRGRLLALAAVTGLTLLSERVSFTAVIERTRVLNALDQLGRRPPDTLP